MAHGTSFRTLALLLSVLLASVHARGQEVDVFEMPGFTPPCRDVEALMQDDGGTLWASCPGENDRQVRYRHDGRSWIEVSDNRLVNPILMGHPRGIYMRKGGELLRVTAQPKDRYRLNTVAPIPGPATNLDFVAVAPNGTTYTETGGAIYRSRARGTQLVASGGAQLLFVSDGGAVIKEPSGKTYFRGETQSAYRGLPSGPVSNRVLAGAGQAAFTLRDSIYAIELLPERPRLHAVCAVPGPGKLSVVGSNLLWIEPGAPVRSRKFEPGATWQKLLRTKLTAAGRMEAVYAGRQLLGFGGEHRAILISDHGPVSVESKPYTPVHLAAMAHNRSSLANAVAESELSIATAQEMFTFERNGTEIGKLIRRYRNADIQMKHSTPLAMEYHRGKLLIATSDSRILALESGQPARELLNIFEAGTVVFDMRSYAGQLWGCLDPVTNPNLGAFRWNPEEGLRVFGVDDGLKDRLLSIRTSPEGSLFGGSKGGTYPLYRYSPADDRWDGVAEAPQWMQSLGAFEVHEVAPICDTLVYLATSHGLYRWSPAAGYVEAALPRRITGMNVRSVVALGNGVCFTIPNKGAYVLANKELSSIEEISSIEDEAAWPFLEFAWRGLRVLGEQHVLVQDRHTLTRIEADWNSRTELRADLTFANNAEFRLAARPESSMRLQLFSMDSIYLRYSLAGFPTSELQAHFTLDGEPFHPVRERSGEAVFASPTEGTHNFEARIMPIRRNYYAATHRQPIRVVGPWYKSTRGVVLMAVLVIAFVLVLAYAYSIRQRKLAKHLENLVRLRTADVEEARRQAEHASEAKSMFLANMSHELRTPLNGVLGMSDLLAETSLTDEQQGHLRAIQRSGSALLRIVGDVLDFAEVDEGIVRLREDEYPLRKLLEEIVFDYAERAVDKGLFLGSSIEVPEHARLDAPKVRSVVGHLLGNAIKFTDTGRVDLFVSVTERTLRIRVDDTGCGIPDSFRPHLFEVFQQADNSATRRHGGTGLGLAIVQTYVACLGGQVTFDSTEGAGSSFSVSLPIRTTALETRDEPTAGAQDIPALLVSDNSDFTGQLQRELGQLGVATTQTLHRTADNDPALAFLVVESLAQLERIRTQAWYDELGRAGCPIVLVGHHRDLLGVRLAPRERTLGYPFEPQALANLCAAAKPTVPSRAAPSPQPTSAPKQAASPFFDLGSTHPLKILVAEDNKMNTMLALSVLRKLGYEADHAENGQVACERYAATPYDLILMDLHMPVMDGLEATRQLRRREADRPPYVCALTANASESGRDECLEAGMDDFLTKPMQVDRLVALLRRVPRLSERMRPTRVTQPAQEA